MSITINDPHMSRRYNAFTEAVDTGWFKVRAASPPTGSEYTYIARIRTWINENCTGRTKQWGQSFAFELETDAVLFTLIWG